MKTDDNGCHDENPLLHHSKSSYGISILSFARAIFYVLVCCIIYMLLAWEAELSARVDVIGDHLDHVPYDCQMD